MTTATSAAADLKRVSETHAANLAADPTRGKGSGHTLVRLEDKLTCAIADGPWHLTSDLPDKNGGGGLGPDPGVLIRAALGSCLAMDIKTWAARLQVPVDVVTVEVTSYLDARGMLGVDATVPPGYQRVGLRITVDSPADAADLERVLATAEAHNPRLYDLTHAIPVERELVVRRDRCEAA